MKHLKIQTKFFLSYLIVSMLVLAGLGTFTYFYFSKDLTSRAYDSQDELLVSFVSQTEANVNDLDSVSINIEYSTLLRNALDSDYTLNISDSTLKTLSSLFVTINGPDMKADQINLYDFNGNVMKVGMKNNIGSVDMKSLGWVEKAQELGGKKVLSLPYKANLLLSAGAVQGDWYLSLYRTVNNQYSRKIGYIETAKACKSIFQSIIAYENRTEDHGSIYICDDEGNVVFPYDTDDAEKKKIMDFYGKVATRPEEHFNLTDEETGKQELISKRDSTYTKWHYAMVQDTAKVLQPVRNFALVLLMTMLTALGVSLFISWWFSRTLVRPIKHLKHIIQRTRVETLATEDAAAKETNYDELDELNDAFQDMSVKLKDSMNEIIETRQQEQKSRTLALQSQINPHFYYNTLASISALAEDGGHDDIIAKMCMSLTKMMRYITAGGADSLATVGAEIDYVGKYLYCMKVRFGDSLTCTIDVDEKMENLPMPHLILQPIVENAIKYGGSTEPPWHLFVTGTIEEDCWKIEVRDSGAGFTEKSIRLMDERIAEAEKNKGMPDIHIDGMGLLNVYLRWKYFTGKDIIFIYGNTEDHHGIVTIGRYTRKNGREDSDGKTGSDCGAGGR